MNSYIQRKNIIRALPFFGLRNEDFFQYLDIANVLTTELNGVRLKLSEKKRKDLEQHKYIQGLKFQLNNRVLNLREISLSKNLITFDNKTIKCFAYRRTSVFTSDSGIARTGN